MWKHYWWLSGYLWWSYRFRWGWRSCLTKQILIKKSICKTQKFYILCAFLLINIILLIAVCIYCYLIKYRANQSLSFRYTNNELTQQTFAGLEDLLENEKLLRWRRLEDVLKICPGDVLTTCLEDLLKILWRQTKYLPGISVYLSRDLTNLNVYLTSLYFTNLYLLTLKRIQNALITGEWFGVMKLA